MTDDPEIEIEDPEPNFDVCIRVLGPIDATGNHDGAGPRPRRAKSMELGVLLALHRPGFTAAQIKAALWPRVAPLPSTFHYTVNEARAWLRRVPDENMIPRADVAGSTRYQMAPCVGTDWDRLQWLQRNARGAATADRLTEALALVRDEPLPGAERWGWAVRDITTMRCAIVDAARELAQLRLNANV